MRVDFFVQSGAFAQRDEQLPDALVGQLASAHGKKNFAAGFFADQRGTARVEVALHGILRPRADRNKALLVALADHADETGLEIEILQARTAQLGYAQPAGVEQLDDGAVAHLQRRLARGGCDETFHFGRGQRVGQIALDFRNGQKLGRVFGEFAALHEMAEKNAQSHGVKFDRRGGGTAAFAPAEELADELGFNRVRRIDLFLFRRPLGEVLERGARAQLVVVGKPALGGEVEDKMINLRVHAGLRPSARRS